MPSDLAEQIPWVHEACEALGVPILTYERFEADDVIGTLATQARGGRVRGRDRHRRQGLLSARPRRHQGLQPARRRDVVRRRRRQGEVRRRAGAGRRRARADGRLDRQHQGRAGHRREGRARPDRDLRHARGAARARRRGLEQALPRRPARHTPRTRVQSRELARIRTDVPVEFESGDAALPRRVARALLRAVHAAGVPHAGHGVRAGRADDRQGLRGRPHARGIAAAGRGAAGGGTIRLPRPPRCARRDAVRHRRACVFHCGRGMRATFRSTVRRREADLFGPGAESGGDRARCLRCACRS